MVADGYKDTNVGIIPFDWDIVELGSICSTTTGKLNANAMVEDGQYKFFTCAKEPYLIDEYKFNTEALLISGNGANVGYIHYYNGKFNAYQRTYVLDEFTNDIQYVKYILQRLLKDRIDKEKNAGNTPYITLDTITKMKIPLPPLKEQEKIADILSTADNKIDAITSQIKKTEILKKGLLQKLLSEGIGHSEFKDSELGKIPESWEVVELENISAFITKGATPTTYGFSWEETGIPFLRSECVSDNGLVMKAAMFISDEAHKHMNRSEIKNGDLLMTITGNVGRVILLEDDISIGNINQHIARIRISSNQVDNKFIYQYVSQDKYRLNYYKITTGQAYPQISLKQVRNSIVPLPPLEEQKQIADILSTADEKLEVLRAKKEKYETLKKGLLQKLLSGKVRVKGFKNEL